MQVRDVMKPGLSNIAEDAAIFTAARLMRDLDVGMLPVEQNGEIVGTVTDRDITVRATASGADPITTPVSRVMSTEVFTCLEDDDLQQAARIMEEHQIRRLIVQNSSGGFIGMLTLADLARHRGMDRLSGEILEEISQPSASAQPGSAH